MPKLSFIAPLAVASVLISIFSCQSSTAERNETKDTTKTISSDVKIKAEKLYDSLRNPWGIAWLPDGRMLITERSGEILVFRDNKFTGEKLIGVPAVFNHGQGGLLDIKLHPGYAHNKWIYISYSKPGKGGATTAVMRFRLDGNQMIDKQEVYEAHPYLEANRHFGSRVVFDKDTMMYVSSGERLTELKVWELDNDHGKVHRLYDDGKVPDDNPFTKVKGARPSIWTLGHRNPQGMVYDAANDRIWAVEHGPKGGDELNLIGKGNNYGWPKACYGVDYDDSQITPHKELEGVTNPTTYWVPSIGPCGMALVTSDRYGASWKGNLLVASLAFRYIARVKLSGTQYQGEEKLLQEIGRVRAIEQGPDGYIYAVTEGPGLLVRLVPE